jgi:hypothetical protein
MEMQEHDEEARAHKLKLKQINDDMRDMLVMA